MKREFVEVYDLSQFFIDEKYQRRGFGIEAVRQIIELMKKDGKYSKVTLCYIDGNEVEKICIKSWDII